MKILSAFSGFLTIILLSLIAGESTGQGKKPNVLFIAVDDLKPYLEPYGDKIVKSPAISSIASKRVVFEKNYCQQAVCAPTRASLMTGLRPDRTGVWDLRTNFRIVDPGIVTMPEYLITRGYETAAFGKIYHPDSITTFKGHDPKSWTIPYPDIKAPNYVTTDKKPAVENADVADSVYYDGKIALAAIKTLGNLAKGNKPFFLAVGFKKPHLPFVAPKKYWDLYKRDQFSIDPYQQKAKNGPEIGYHESKELKNYSDIEPFDSYSNDPDKHLSVEKQKELIHGYYACISYTDALINQLLVELKRLNLDKNTIVVLWGDHGWHLGDHGMWNKHSNFEQDDQKKSGTGTLYANNVKLGEGKIERVGAGFFGHEGLNVGIDDLTPVSSTYKVPFTFNAIIRSVTVDLKSNSSGVVGSGEIKNVFKKCDRPMQSRHFSL